MEMVWLRGWVFTRNEINSDSKDFEVCHPASASTPGCTHIQRDEGVGEPLSGTASPSWGDPCLKQQSSATSLCSAGLQLTQDFPTRSKWGEQTWRERKSWRELGEYTCGDLSSLAILPVYNHPNVPRPGQSRYLGTLPSLPSPQHNRYITLQNRKTRKRSSTSNSMDCKNEILLPGISENHGSLFPSLHGLRGDPSSSLHGHRRLSAPSSCPASVSRGCSSHFPLTAQQRSALP